MLDKLKFLYKIINNLNSNTKTIIIIFLLLSLFSIRYINYVNHTIKDYNEQIDKDKHLAECYTKTITPYVNFYCEDILAKDKDITNVILLNYHNTLVSTNGLSYRYLTSILEKKRGFETKSISKLWKELDYMQYGGEIERINDNTYLRLDSIYNYKNSLPNLVEILSLSNAHSAAFYPIKGIRGYIGMIIIIYDKKKEYSLGYYQEVIAPSIQPLAILLDYNSIKDKFEEISKTRKVKLNDLL